MGTRFLASLTARGGDRRGTFFNDSVSLWYQKSIYSLTKSRSGVLQLTRVSRWIGDQFMDFPVLEYSRVRCRRKGDSGLTRDGESVVRDLGRDLDAPSPLSVIRSAQARHVGDAPLVDVHHTV